MRLCDLFETNEVIDWEMESAEEIFKTDANGNPVIGQFKTGYSGLDYKTIASKAKAKAGQYPRQERLAIRDVIDVELAQRKQPSRPNSSKPPSQPAPPKAPKPTAAKRPSMKFDNDSQSTSSPSLPDVSVSKAAKWAMDKFMSGTKLADRYTKTNKK